MIQWFPGANEDVLNVACAAASSVAVAICVVPSKNINAPVGTPLPMFGLTDAVNVTDCRKGAGFAEDVSPVEVAAVLTVSLTAAEALPAKLGSPEYFAVMEWVPSASDEVPNVTCPFAPSVPVPSSVEVSRNCTTPVGVPVVELETVAANVTDCAKDAGFGEDVSAVELAA